MERELYRNKGVLLIPDYLVNSGGVIFAAQERYIPTPEHLQIPKDYLGNKEKVEEWLNKNANEFQRLSDKRSETGRKMRDDVIRHNIIQLISLLSQDANMLPSEAAEKISLLRIVLIEKKRTVGEIMCEISTIKENTSVLDAAKVLLESEAGIIAVVSAQGKLLGVVTDWDIMHALSDKSPYDTDLRSIMSSHLVTVKPKDHILDSIRKLELHGISAMPVVGGKRAVGVVSSDIFARQTLLRLLQTSM